MIKLGFTGKKGMPVNLDMVFFKELSERNEIATLKKRASILEDNGETGPKKAFWSKT